MTRTLGDEERADLKRAAFGAIFLVSNAEPGALSMIKESIAASNAFAEATGLVREVLTTGPLPEFPGGPDEVGATVLPGLRRAVEILLAKAPGEAERYRSTVLAAVEEVARAHRGVSPNEAAMIASIRDALDSAG